MGRSKPRTNKRPPPKPRVQPTQSVLSAPLPDPIDSTFSAALSNWSANALGRLDHLPKLTQSQLTALTDAAAGVGEANFLANPSSIPPQSYNPNIPIDLPASLAALFEAKLTLDREKAKLLRMQQELKGQKEGKQIREEPLEPRGTVVALEEECTCGHHHSYPPSDHSECEYECEEDCDCDCHSYIEDYECEHVDEHGHGHSHAHASSHDHAHGHGHGHDHDHDHGHQHQHGHEHEHAHDEYEYDHDYDPDHDHEYDDDEPPKRPLSEDPERLDETVRELFNWIKAVVWTIEQAAIVSGRRNWTQPK
nr:uncharacterized protein CI109_002128 [Kwoniella shandongensis]KAA5529702.1 hypothetical protein CI109_002128 [Kwoniella shandongensis]